MSPKSGQSASKSTAARNSETQSEVNEEFIKLFATAALGTLKIQCKMTATLVGSFKKGAYPQKPFDIGGIIGVTSQTVKGSVALCITEPVFLKILNGILGVPYTEINAENEDAAAELLNIIFGHVKSILNKKGHVLQKAIPSVIRGKDVEAKYSKNPNANVLVFKTDEGEFYVELLLEATDAKEKEDMAKVLPKKPTVSAAEKAAFFVPFLQGTIKALKLTCNLDAKPGKSYEKATQPALPFDLAGIIGISSNTVNGSYALVFKKDVFQKLASQTFEEPIEALQPDTEDLVGELVNMSLGHAKTILNAQGHGIQMSIPTIIRGNNVKSSSPQARRIIIIPLSSPLGDFHVEINTEV